MVRSARTRRWTRSRVSSHDFQLWQIYLDNLDMLEIIDEAALSDWVRTTSRGTEDAREVYELYKVERSKGKAILREPEGKLLGSHLRRPSHSRSR